MSCDHEDTRSHIITNLTETIRIEETECLGCGQVWKVDLLEGDA